VTIDPRDEAIDIRYRVAIFTAAFGGLRVGETLGAQGAESESAQAPPRCPEFSFVPFLLLGGGGPRSSMRWPCG
jgi:hypothetical protein